MAIGEIGESGIGSGVEWSRTEQNGAERSRTEQNGAEWSRIRIIRIKIKEKCDIIT